LVAGRTEPSGKFVTVDDLPIPEPCRDLFAGIPATDFRLDLSSSYLRQQTQPSTAAEDV
jgi:hypothetical protein